VAVNFDALAEWLGQYGYPLLFAAVFAENAGLPVPGETALLAGGLLAGRPEARLSIVGVIAVAFVAAVLGDNFGFWLGRRWARARLEQGRRFLFLTPNTLKSVEGYFDRYGTLTVFFARFVAGLRVVAALAAGTTRMSWPRFLLANAAGGLAWASAMGLLGYFFGQSWEALHHWLGRGALLALGSIVVLVGLAYLWRHARRVPAQTWGRLLRGEVLQGVVAAVLVVLCLTLLVQIGRHHGAPTREDRHVRDWIEGHDAPWLDAAATVGSYLGSLPVVVGLSAALLLWLWSAGRPWREAAALLWAVAAGEGVGLLLLGLLRHRGVEPARAEAWPFGFAGLGPLRAAAAFGMMAHLLLRPSPGRGRWVGVAALLLPALVAFSVVWTGEQSLTEALVELAVGGLVLFLGLWWLEGQGLGPRPGPETKQEARLPEGARSAVG
jgi:membrane protein DedA with SNARE-associated domain